MNPKRKKHYQHAQRAAALFTLGAVLTACGGGGSDNAAPDLSASVSVAPCPTGYKSVTIDKTSVAGAPFNIVVANATFAFSTLTEGTQPSLQICMGQPAQALSQTGFYTLSETYDLEVTPLNQLSSGVQNLQRKLTVQFALSGLPVGTSSVDMVNKIKVYQPEASGVWKPMSQSAINVQFGDSSVVASSVEVSPDFSGKFVVAYKP